MPPTPEITADSVAARVARAWSAEFALELDREAVSFLGGIHALLGYQPEPFLTELQLRDIFALVSELAHGDPTTLAQRSTRAIARLREQQLLVRGDLGGLTQEGEYGLSQLGKAIAEWVLQEETLTRENLETMMTRIRADLLEVKQAAEVDRQALHWGKTVVAPLKFSVAGLMQLIDRRSRGLDREQELVRARISELLEAGWFDAIEACENLLGEVAGTLGELNRALMSETEGASTLLSAIFDLAAEAEHEAAQQAVLQVRLQLERVSLWGEGRHQAWSDYYQSVHEFIRSVVRVDQERAWRSRLRAALQGYAEQPWALLACEQAGLRRLREPEALSNIARQGWKAGAIQDDLAEGGAARSGWEELLEGLTARLAENRRLSLLEVLRAAAPELDETELYRLAGELLRWLPGQARPSQWQASEWRSLGPHLSVQDLTVTLDTAFPPQNPPPASNDNTAKSSLPLDSSPAGEGAENISSGLPDEAPF